MTAGHAEKLALPFLDCFFGLRDTSPIAGKKEEGGAREAASVPGATELKFDGSRFAIADDACGHLQKRNRQSFLKLGQADVRCSSCSCACGRLGPSAAVLMKASFVQVRRPQYREAWALFRL